MNAVWLVLTGICLVRAAGDAARYPGRCLTSLPLFGSLEALFAVTMSAIFRPSQTNQTF